MKDLKISQYSKEKISCNIPPNSGIAKSLVSLNIERELNEKEKAKEIIMTLSKNKLFNKII